MTDPFAEYEAEMQAANQKALAAYDAPEAVAARQAKRDAEFAKGLRLGWWDADGNSLTPENDEDEDQDEEDEE